MKVSTDASTMNVRSLGPIKDALRDFQGEIVTSAQPQSGVYRPLMEARTIDKGMESLEARRLLTAQFHSEADHWAAEGSRPYWHASHSKETDPEASFLVLFSNRTEHPEAAEEPVEHSAHNRPIRWVAGTYIMHGRRQIPPANEGDW
jgi:hypothetical protein